MINIFRNWMNRYFADEEAVLVVILLAAAVVLMMTLGDILAPIIASVIIAFLMEGMVARLKGIGVPHIVAVVIALLVVVGAIIVLLFVLLPGMWNQISNLVAEVPGMVSEMRRVALLLPEQYPNVFSESFVDESITNTNRQLSTFSNSVLSFSVAKLPLLIAVAIYIVLVPILVFFFLKDGKKILSWLGRFLPNNRPVMTQIWVEMNIQIANYVRGKAIEILIVTSVSYLSFALLGLNYALLLAITVGMSVLIPYIGAVVATIPIALIGFFQWGWSSELMTVIIVYGVIQMLDGNVLVPLLFSEAVNLHPIAIILAVLFFGGIWGFWGVFFAIPLATLTKAIITAWPTREQVLHYHEREAEDAKPAEGDTV
ncbi:AI-2E family transporter [Aurantivibrio infirmus]